MPVLGALCAARGLDVLPVFMVATLAGSCGFMLPWRRPERHRLRHGFRADAPDDARRPRREPDRDRGDRGYVWLVAF